MKSLSFGLCVRVAVAVAVVLAAPLPAQFLTRVASYVEGDLQNSLTIDGLNFPWAAAVTSDGASVYVCSGVANIGGGEDDNAVATFSRAGATGELTWVEVDFDDQEGGSADGLFSCRDVVVSGDGKFVYTAGSSDDKIGRFSRNLTTGALTFGAAVTDNAAGVNGIDGVEDLALSPDGMHLYAAGRADDALAVFSRDATTGALTFVEAELNGLAVDSSLDRPLAVDVSPDGKHVYSAAGSNVNFAGSDALAAFSRDAGTGALTFVEAYFEGQAQGANTIDGLDQVTDVKVSPDGKHVYAASEVDTLGGASGNGNDWIAIFSRDTDTLSPDFGKLTWLARIAGFKICPTSPFGADAWSFLAISPDGLRVYVLKNWADNGVAVFERDPTTGLLTFINSRCEFDPDFIGLTLPAKIALAPGAKHLYATGVAGDALVAFRVCSPSLDGLDVVLPDQDVSTPKTEIACKSITAADYDIFAGGDVMFIAPLIVLDNGFEVNDGVFMAVHP